MTIAMAQTARVHAALRDFSAFYLETWNDAYRLALAITRDATTALDVAQEAYLAAYAARDRFRGDGAAVHWLLRIVANKAASHGRTRGRQQRLGQAAWREWRGHAPKSPEERALDRAAIESALASLTVQQRAAVVLRYVHGYDYASIGEVLDMTPSNVGATLSRALPRLRRAMTSEDSDE